MRTISAAAVTDAVAKLCIQANTHLPPRHRLRPGPHPPGGALASCQRDPGPAVGQSGACGGGKNCLSVRTRGWPVCFWSWARRSTSRATLSRPSTRGSAGGYGEGYLRKSIVGDPLRRVNTEDNTPAAITLRLVPGDGCRITVAPKGFGSENMSRLGMLKPADGVEGVKKFVVETVRLAGSNPCPPIVLGIGIGGSFDKAAYLAKHALLRPIDQPNSDPFYAQLEEELLEEINALGIGPQGFGGRTTCLGLSIETAPPPTWPACPWR